MHLAGHDRRQAAPLAVAAQLIAPRADSGTINCAATPHLSHTINTLWMALSGGLNALRCVAVGAGDLHVADAGKCAARNELTGLGELVLLRRLPRRESQSGVRLALPIIRRVRKLHRAAGTVRDRKRRCISDGDS